MHRPHLTPPPLLADPTGYLRDSVAKGPARVGELVEQPRNGNDPDRKLFFKRVLDSRSEWSEDSAGPELGADADVTFHDHSPAHSLGDSGGSPMQRCASNALLMALVGVVAFVAATASAARADYMQTVLTDNPSAYYRLGEPSGTTAFDSSGNSHSGTYRNVTLGQPSAIFSDPNTSALFNGSTSIVDTGFLPTDSSFTVEAWARPTQASANFQIVAGISGGPQLSYGSATQPGRPAFSFFSGGTFLSTTATVSLPLNTYSYLVGTWDNTTKILDIYINGILNNSTTLSSATPSLDSSTTAFQIGAFDETLHGGTFKAQFFGGGIDEVAYYSTALSADRIRAHFLAGAVPEPGSLTLMVVGVVPLVVSSVRRLRVGGTALQSRDPP